MKRALLPALPALVAVLLGISSVALISAASAHAEEFNLEVGTKDERVLDLPEGPSNGGLVVFLHGLAGAPQDINNISLSPATDALTAAGFTVAADDSGGVANWGDAPSVEENVRMIEELDFPRVYLWGGSMGGLDAVKLIEHVHPRAVAMFSPVCDPQFLGGPVVKRWARLKWPDGPPQGPLPHDAEGLPVVIWASPEDTWVPKAHNADVCASRLRADGADVTEVTTEGQHGDQSNIRPDWLVRLFSQN